MPLAEAWNAAAAVRDQENVPGSISPARQSTSFPRPVEKSVRLRLSGGAECADLAHIVEHMFESIAQ